MYIYIYIYIYTCVYIYTYIYIYIYNVYTHTYIYVWRREGPLGWTCLVWPWSCRCVVPSVSAVLDNRNTNGTTNDNDQTIHNTHNYDNDINDHTNDNLVILSFWHHYAHSITFPASCFAVSANAPFRKLRLPFRGRLIH